MFVFFSDYNGELASSSNQWGSSLRDTLGVTSVKSRNRSKVMVGSRWFLDFVGLFESV